MNDKPRLELVLEHYGADVGTLDHESSREYDVKCPFHEDRVASGRANFKMGVYFCHGCQAKGNGFDLIMKQEGVDFRGAVQWARDNLGYTSERSARPAPKPPYRPSWM